MHNSAVKIVGIGLSKTGTTTLREALQIIGFRHCRATWEYVKFYRDMEFEKLGQVLHDYDSFDDFPWPNMYKWIDHEFPHSKFILTLRTSPDQWLQSMQRHAKRSGGEKAREINYGFSDPEMFPNAYRNIYVEHERKVIEYFEDRPEKLLVVCWENGEGWRELCNFLGVQQPDVRFPAVNTSPAPTRIMLRQLHHQTRRASPTYAFLYSRIKRFPFVSRGLRLLRRRSGAR